MPRLPLVDAIEYRGEFSSGTTRPCVFLCESAEGATEEYVTKMRHDVRGSGLAFEYIASHLARHFGIDSPAAALVNLSLDLAVAQKQNANLCDRIIRNVGLNFGTVFLEGFSTWLPSKHLPVGLRQQAAEILAFDGLIDNADRRREKPNLLAGGQRLIIIDHEVTFSFVRLVGTQGPWFQRLQFLRDHPLFDGVRGREFSLDPFRGRLLTLSDELIDEICFGMPADFMSEHSQRIAGHLKAVRSDADDFLRGIAEVLQ